MNSRTKNILIFSLISFIGSILILTFFLYQVDSKGKQLDIYTSAISEKRAQETAFLKIRRLVEETAAERDLLSAIFFSSESDSITFLGEVEGFARDINLDLKTLDLNTITSTKDTTEYISMTFSYSGSKEKVRDFTTYLETIPYHSRITNLTLERGAGGTWESTATLHITISPS